MNRPLSTSQEPSARAGSSQPHEVRHQIVIVGGGTAGIAVAARLTKGWFHKTDVAIIEPSTRHYYQPLWTLVGAGAAALERTHREEAAVIPRKATWIRDAVTALHPDENYVTTRSGTNVRYDYLVVAAGNHIRWDGIRGLKDAIGHDGVCSNYAYEYVQSTWDTIRNFSGGTALFTQPAGAIKCGGAPQKICYLAEDYFRRAGIRDRCRVIYASATAGIFAVEKYRKALDQIVQRRGIETLFRHNLIEIRAANREAVFENLDTGQHITLHYDMLHVTPPMGPPDFIAHSPLADAGGWVDVDKHTLQHVRYPNVFALGDCSNLPTSKTGAAIRKQAPVLVANLRAAMHGKPLAASYDGYTSCPVVTRYGRVILAEFDYDKQPKETFPFDQSKERWSMWVLKKYLLPLLYWKGMVKGRM